MLISYIWLIDRTLKGTTKLGLGGQGGDGNERYYAFCKTQAKLYDTVILMKCSFFEFYELWSLDTRVNNISSGKLLVGWLGFIEYQPLQAI